MRGTIKIKRVLIGIGLILFAIIMLSMFRDESLTVYLCIGLIIAGILFLVFSRAKNYFCADCGQFLGSGMDALPVCPRCGSNISTNYYNGVGRTYRNR